MPGLLIETHNGVVSTLVQLRSSVYIDIGFSFGPSYRYSCGLLLVTFINKVGGS